MTRLRVSDGIELRLLGKDDAAALFTLVDDNRAHLRRWLPWVDGTESTNDSMAFIEAVRAQFAKDGTMQSGVYYDGALVGMCGLLPISSVNNSVLLGYWLAEHRSGEGIITASAKRLVSYAFSDLGVNKVSITAAVDNHKSRAIPERLAFTLEGVERAAAKVNGAYHDHVHYSVLRSEWMCADVGA